MKIAEVEESLMSQQDFKNKHSPASIAELDLGSANTDEHRSNKKNNFSPMRSKNSEKSLAGLFHSVPSESGTSRHSTHRRNKSPSRRKNDQQQQKKAVKNHLDIIFKAINERPLLDDMTREERIREKLKFFKLETESLEESKKRIDQKVAESGTRFGPRSSNMKLKHDLNKAMFNPFTEMMTIEAEYGGSIFDHDQPVKKTSDWFPMSGLITQKRSQAQYDELVRKANRHKEQVMKERQLELIKQQIARGVKNVNLQAMSDEEGGPKPDVGKMIAEEQRRAQKQRMDRMITMIRDLNEKSMNDTINMEEIREFVQYKYPVGPSTDRSGRNIYDDILSRVDSKWEMGALDDMKYKSRSKSRQSSPRTVKYQRKMVGSINFQDFGHTVETRNDLEMDNSAMSQSNAPFNITCNTTREQGQGQGQGGQTELIDMVASKQGQTWGRKSSNRNTPNSLTVNQNNFDLFCKRAQSKDSMGHDRFVRARLTAGATTTAQQNRFTKQGRPDHREDESFFNSTDEPLSPFLREDKQMKLPSTPITDTVWKKHLVIKQVAEAEGLNTYAGELAVEMRIYCQSRLENIQTNIDAIIDRLKELKSAKQRKGKSKQPKQRSVAQPTPQPDVRAATEISTLSDYKVQQDAQPLSNPPKKEDAKPASEGVLDDVNVDDVDITEEIPDDAQQKEQANSEIGEDIQDDTQQMEPADAEIVEDILDEIPLKEPPTQLDDSINDETLAKSPAGGKQLDDEILDETLPKTKMQLAIAEDANHSGAAAAQDQKNQTTPFVNQEDQAVLAKEVVQKPFSVEETKRDTTTASKQSGDGGKDKFTAPQLHLRESTADLSRSPTPQPELTSTPIAFNVQKNSAAQGATASSSKIIMKTVNDTVFDVSLIDKFNKNDYKKTKVCRESIKPALQKIQDSDLINFCFDWTNCFKYSIFHECLENELIPLILVLKKFARTNRGNRSLRCVLARNLVNFKTKFNVIEPEELPAVEDDIKEVLNNNNDLEDQNLNLRQDGGDNNISNIYQDSLYRDADMTLSFAYAARLPSQQNDPLSPSVGGGSGAAEIVRNGSPFKVATVGRTSDGSDNQQSPLNIVPITTQVDATAGATNNVRLSEASRNRRKFGTQVQSNQQANTNGTLPTLVKDCGPPEKQNSVTANRLPFNVTSPRRLIKTSHAKKRSQMPIGELNDLRPLQETSSTMSPLLPAQQKASEARSNLKSVTMTKRSKKSMPAGGTRTKESAEAWPQHYGKLSIVPGSVYTGPILNTQPATTKSFKSISMTAQSYRLKAAGKTGSTKRSSSRKRNPQSPQSNKTSLVLSSKQLEQILAKRILMRTSERKEPKSYQRNPAFHKSMAQQMGLRTLSSGKPGISNVLKAESSTLKALRAGSSGLNSSRGAAAGENKSVVQQPRV